ncbi:hypothetical protein EV191_1011471 [Tamaricihabitans halophyticus]|uniref:Transglycosylase-like protein with SLT domain n=2 Tax=Tamaricihabitans halophyticus TaxID=1262583 RepID=A0A4R2R644_9PSEU|nr:hypothetical protein EV191_1011471 [Tamaricihabitans halophyticus]
MRALAVSAGALMAIGLSSSLASAESTESGSPLAPGTHIPMSMATDSMVLECDTIPSEHDPEIIKIVYDVATERGADDRVMLSAFEAGWVESHMNNLDCGHSDSLGVFQQRPSQGWGTPEEIMDPVYATNAYLDQAIPNAENNPDWTAGEVAQSVQRSAYPDRYDESEAKAKELIAEAEAAAAE